MTKIAYEILLVLLGTFGVMGVPMTGLFPDRIFLGTIFLGMIAAFGWVAVFHLNKKTKVIGIGAALGVLMLTVLLNMERIQQEIFYIMDLFAECVRRESGQVLFSGKLSKGQIAENESLIVINLAVILIAFLIAIEVVYIRSVFAALIMILPLLTIFIMVAVVPGMSAFLCSILYIFGTATFKQKEGGYTTGYIMLALGMLLYLCIAIFIPKKEYQRQEIFTTLYSKADTVMSSLMDTFWGIKAPGGINYGQLGRINEIKYSGMKLASVRTIETGRNQYLKTFTGVEYQGDQWITKALKAEEVTRSLFSMMDASREVQEYITNSSGDSYYNKTKVYYYTLKENGADADTQQAYSMESADYSKFKNIADQVYEVRNTYNPSSDNVSVHQYITRENAARIIAQQEYCDMPSNVRKLMEEVCGSVSASTYYQKINYINYVKSFLSNNYSYTINPGMVPAGRDFLDYFLMDSKEGYCTYFASAATMMFRYAGIPARYCEGYVLSNDNVLEGNQITAENVRYTLLGKDMGAAGDMKTSQINAYEVELTDRNAHAWVEIYMDGYGWLPIEVTPGSGTRDSMQTAQLEEGNANEASVDIEEQTDEFVEEETETQAIASNSSTESQTIAAIENTNGKEGKANYLTKELLIVVAVIAVLLMLLCLIQYRKNRIYRSRRHYLEKKDENNAEEQVSCLYDYFITLLNTLGYHKPEGMDYEAYAEMLEEQNEELKQCRISELMSLLLKFRFYKSTDINEKEFHQIQILLDKLKQLVYEKTTGVKKIKAKYIDAL